MCIVEAWIKMINDNCFLFQTEKNIVWKIILLHSYIDFKVGMSGV